MGSKHPVLEAFEELSYFGTFDSKARKFTKHTQVDFDGKKTSDIDKYLKNKEELARLGLSYENIGYGNEPIKEKKADKKSSLKSESDESESRKLDTSVTNVSTEKLLKEVPVNYMTPNPGHYHLRQDNFEKTYHLPSNSDQFCSPYNVMQGPKKISLSPLRFPSISPKSPKFLSFVNQDTNTIVPAWGRSDGMIPCSPREREKPVSFDTSNSFKQKQQTMQLSTQCSATVKRNVACIAGYEISQTRKRKCRTMQILGKTDSS